MFDDEYAIQKNGNKYKVVKFQERHGRIIEYFVTEGRYGHKWCNCDASVPLCRHVKMVNQFIATGVQPND